VKTDVEALRARLRASLQGEAPVGVEGRVVGVRGATVRAVVPGARVGDVVQVTGGRRVLEAEVAGFEEGVAVLVPLGETAGVGLDDAVRVLSKPSLRCGEGMLGRVVDGRGEPVDGLGPLGGSLVDWPRERPAPMAMRRRRVEAPLPLGGRVIDGLATLGEGQRIGVFAGPGAGKSALLGQVARQAPVDATVVALVGERGREVRDFVEGTLGARGMQRTCVVVATSDEAAALRVRATHTALAVAEFFREQGLRVLLMIDSLTRVARAQRDVGLAAGEAPVRRAYPPSVFTLLPRLIERMGPGERGSITALLTVLVEGDGRDDPIAEEARGLLDGHLVLDASIGARGRWPAIDPVASLSRSMGAVTDEAHHRAAMRVRQWLAALEGARDLLAMGAYTPGRDPTLDEALARRPRIEAFLRQDLHDTSAFEATRGALLALVDGAATLHTEHRTEPTARLP